MPSQPDPPREIGPPTEAASGPPGRITALDGLRGVAAVVVLLNHLMQVDPMIALLNALRPAPEAGVASLVTFTPLHAFWAGNEAVMVFFVLSGFVLTVPVLRPGRRFAWLPYYPSRLIRLYVPVIASVALALVWALLVVRRPSPGLSIWIAGHDEPYTVLGALADASLLVEVSPLNSPLWSLRYEVLFSLLLPAYVLLIRRFRRAWWALALVAVAVAGAGRLLQLGPVQYLPVFAVGVAMAVGRDDLERLARRLDRAGGLAWWALAILAFVAFTASWDLVRIDADAPALLFPATLLSAAAAVFLAVHWTPARRFLELRFVHWLGVVSFSLYLTHEPLVVSLALLLPPGLAWLVPVLGIPLALLLAWAFFHLVERPSHRLARLVAAGVAATRRSVPGPGGIRT